MQIPLEFSSEMILKWFFIPICFLTLSQNVNSYVLFAANMDDFHSLAKKIIPSQLAEQIANFAARSGFKYRNDLKSDDIDLTEYHEDAPKKRYHVKSQQNTEDIDLDELVERVKDKLDRDHKTGNRVKKNNDNVYVKDVNINDGKLPSIDDYYYKDEAMNFENIDNTPEYAVNVMKATYKPGKINNKENIQIHFNSKENVQTENGEEYENYNDENANNNHEIKDITENFNHKSTDLGDYGNTEERYDMIKKKVDIDSKKFDSDIQKDYSDSKAYENDPVEYAEVKSHDYRNQEMNDGYVKEKNVQKVAKQIIYKEQRTDEKDIGNQNEFKQNFGFETTERYAPYEINKEVIENNTEIKEVPVYYDEEQPDGDLLKEVNLQDAKDSYEDYVTPKKDDVFASEETTKAQKSDATAYHRQKNEANVTPANVKFKFNQLTSKIQINAVKRDNMAIKAKTESLLYDVYDKKEETNNNVKETASTKKFKGTMIPTREYFKMSSPNYYAKIKAKAEKYNFDEPLPEKDREPEKIKYFDNPPASINKKVNL